SISLNSNLMTKLPFLNTGNPCLNRIERFHLLQRKPSSRSNRNWKNKERCRNQQWINNDKNNRLHTYIATFINFPNKTEQMTNHLIYQRMLIPGSIFQMTNQ